MGLPEGALRAPDSLGAGILPCAQGVDPISSVQSVPRHTDPMIRLGHRGVLAVLAVSLALAGCGAGHGLSPDPDSGPPVSAAPARSLPRPAHVLIIVLENHAEQQVMSQPNAPYLRALANTGARFTNSHAVAHPSQPNYIALFSGSTHGVTGDQCPQDLGARPNLAQQLHQAGHSFTGYSENLPGPGYTGCAAGGGYARKHNPWVDFSNVPAASNRPYTNFPTQLSTLPTVSFIIPNLCHDMHDCDVATGDRWARDHLRSYVTWAHTHNSLLIVTFDEDEGTTSNHIPTFLVGPMVKPTTIAQPIDHYNVLRTIEDMYGLDPLGHARQASALTGWN